MVSSGVNAEHVNILLTPLHPSKKDLISSYNAGTHADTP